MPQRADFVFYVVVVTLATVLVSVVLALLFGLFTPTVDNSEIFKIIGPAFQMIVGAFVGILSGKVLGSNKKDSE